MNEPIHYNDEQVATNPADWYWREDVFTLERQHIFMKNWQLLARSAQLENSGDYLASSIAGIPVIACRSDDGELRAFHNICRHRAARLVEEGQGNCKRLQCGYHAWTYDLEGKLIAAPAITDEAGFDSTQFNLFPLRCEAWNGLVFVNFDQQAVNLADWLGDIVEIMQGFPGIDTEFVFTREEIVDFEANWKTYGDNSCEGYHLPTIHRDMAAEIDRKHTNIEARHGEYVNFDVSYKDGSKACWIYRYPNFMIACEPAYINIQSTDPISSRLSRLRDYFWFSRHSDKQRIEQALNASDLVTEEDRNICVEVQANLQSGVYQRGVLSATQEHGTRYFQELVRRDIGNLVE